MPHVFVSSTKRQGSQKLRDLIKQEARKIEKKESLIVRQGRVEESKDKIVVEQTDGEYSIRLTYKRVKKRQ